MPISLNEVILPFLVSVSTGNKVPNEQFWSSIENKSKEQILEQLVLKISEGHAQGFRNALKWYYIEVNRVPFDNDIDFFTKSFISGVKSKRQRQRKSGI